MIKLSKNNSPKTKEKLPKLRHRKSSKMNKSKMKNPKYLKRLYLIEFEI